MGRLKIRWEDDVKKDIQRLKVPNWKTFVQDRRRWKEVAEKAKTLHQELCTIECEYSCVWAWNGLIWLSIRKSDGLLGTQRCT
jgi:hypothetical protein